MNVDLDLLQQYAELLKREWDGGLWKATFSPDDPPPFYSNPGAVAEMTLRLIESHRALQEEMRVTDFLLADRERVLRAVPECPIHGPCVPHAEEWIAKMIANAEERDRLTAETIGKIAQLASRSDE